MKPKTVDGIVTRKIGKSTMALCGDLELAKELAANAGLTQDEAKLIAELNATVFEKHNLLTGYAPEILLAVVLGEWTMRIGIVMTKLNQMQAAQKNHANTSQANKDTSDR